MGKKGLVVEGGGMRGAHTSGILWAMAEKGQIDFDVVTATSAGACTVAFIVARQFGMFTRIWQHHLHGGQFIRFRNLPFLRRSVMDLDYLIDEVFREKEPLDVEAIRQSPIQFFITATDCETGLPFYFNNRDHPILQALKASSAIPLAYRAPVVINGRRYMDGGISESIPIQKAIDEGCAEITVLLTRPPGYRKKPSGFNLVARLYRRRYPALAAAIENRHRAYNETMDRIERQAYPARLTVIRPNGPLPLSRMTTGRGKILEAIRLGYEDGMLALTSSSPSHKI